MKSVDFRNDPIFLRNQFARDGIFEIPIIKKMRIDLNNIALIGYDKLIVGKTDKMYISSSMMISLRSFEEPEPRVERLKEYRAIRSQQFNMYTEMPVAVQIHQVFKNGCYGAYFQSKGLKVIPSLVWGEADTFWFRFDGIEEGSIVGVLTVGMRTEKAAVLVRIPGNAAPYQTKGGHLLWQSIRRERCNTKIIKKNA